MTSTLSNQGRRVTSKARARRSKRREQRWIPGDLLVSLSMMSVVLSAANSLPRLFRESTYQGPILAAAIVGCVLATLGRFLRLPFFVAPLISGPLVGLLGAQRCFPDLLPKTWTTQIPYRAITAAIRFDWSQLSSTKAPVTGRPGFALSAIFGAWLVSVLSDLLAFSLRSPIEALVPPAVLVVVGALVAPPGHRVGIATLCCAAGIFHVCATTLAASRRRPWADGSAPPAWPQLARIGALVGLAIVVSATVIPKTGVAEREALIDWRTGNLRKLPTKVTSPLVSLKRQILDLPDTVMFRARAVDQAGLPARTYWRLSTLTTFNGTSWTANSTYSPVNKTGVLLAPEQGNTQADINADVVVEGLVSSWLPMAYQAQQFTRVVLDPSITVGIDRRGGSVLVSKATKPGIQYQASSVRGTVENAQAKRLADPGWNGEDLSLPQEFPNSVREVASRVVGEEESQLNKLVALQSFFRNKFTYSTDVPPPSKQSDLERFVLTDRAGYCEQFSGAFAAMARSVGIPARVVVGFSPGRLDEDGRWVITGKNSHAWPEAYVDGLGWLPFEPTPGRGIPGAENYTGVAYQDDSERISPEVTTTTQATIKPSPTPTLAPQRVNPVNPKRNSGTSLWWILAPVVLAIGSAITLIAGNRRQRDRVEFQWRAVSKRLAALGIEPTPLESEEAFAERAAGSLPSEAAQSLRRLASQIQTHRYGPTELWSDADTAAFVAEAERFRPELRSR